MTDFMNKEQYLNEVKSRLAKLLESSKAGYKLPDIERHRLEGFIQAGVFLKLTTNVEMNSLMESLHFEVFGKTIETRKKENSAIWPDISIDYEQYEQPTFERKD